MDVVAAPELTGDRPAGSKSGRDRDVLALFAVLWAAANLFHVLGPSGRAIDVVDHRSTVALAHVAVAVAALVVLAKPRSVPRFLVLALLGPLSAWFEAPRLGSHWFLVSVVDLALRLAAVATAAWRPERRDRFARAAAWVARWCLLIGYSFAAFAKLNSAFFTPRVSCGNFFFNELMESLHIGLRAATSGVGGYLNPVATAAIELSVPLLLVFRRTRVFGVLLGLLFHSMIALDMSHLFSDFSSVLIALFVLFLPAEFAASISARWRALAAAQRDRIRVAVVGLLALLLVVEWLDRTTGSDRLFSDGRVWAWLLYDAVVLVAVFGWVWRHRSTLARGSRERLLAWSGVPRWLIVVPVFLVLNGLAPYLEIRTAYGFNMYANLVTADGDSNHFIFARTLPLTDFQSDQVQIISTSDAGLAPYASQGWDLPYLQLRDYLSQHPDASVVYKRGAVTHVLAHARDDPALVERVPSWESKLFAFRALDQSSPARCQPGFLAAN